jgi:hypothetical protein
MTEVERIVSRAKRGRRAFTAAIAALCLVLIGAVAFAIVVNFQQSGDITRVERSSACESDPRGEECQRVKRESDEAQSIRDTCRSFWKVGYACPAPGSNVTVRQAEGGDALQPASADQQPGAGSAPALPGNPPPKAGKPPAGKDPGQSSPAAPETESPQPQLQPPPTSSAPSDPGEEATSSEPPPTQESPGLVGGLTEGLLGGALEGIGKGADAALCPPVDRLAPLCSD